jgi:plastocyanin
MDEGVLDIALTVLRGNGNLGDMPAKVQRDGTFRRVVLASAAALTLAASNRHAGDVRGRLTVTDRGDHQAKDVGQAVVWLDRPGPVPPVTMDITTADKEFSPHVLVVPVGSTVAFPNHDPFNHNVFSLSAEQPFDLGLYGRGQTRSIKLEHAGIIRVYCNVHAQMSALIVVRDGPYFTQPSGDGSFVLPQVPAGRYLLHAWHERAEEVVEPVDVPAGGLADVSLQLDARGYRFKPHLNKHGQPYPQEGRRY